MPLKSPHPPSNLGKANMIVGVGTDIVEIPRIGKMIERHGEHFLTRVYTDEEIRYCQRRKESFPTATWHRGVCCASWLH